MTECRCYRTGIQGTSLPRLGHGGNGAPHKPFGRDPFGRDLRVEWFTPMPGVPQAVEEGLANPLCSFANLLTVSFGGGIQKVADEFKGYQRERIGYCVTSGSGVRIVRECSMA